MRKPLEKFVPFPFKSSCIWLRAVPGTTGERILPEKHKMVWWGGDHAEISAVALLEYSREKENKTQLQTHWTHCSAEFQPFNSAGRITKTWPEGALWVLPLPGKGHLTPFRKRIIYGTFLSYPQSLLIHVESLGNFPDFEDDFNFQFLLKLGMWCRCWGWLKSMSSLFCAVAKYNWSWWHQSPGRQLKAGKW